MKLDRITFIITAIILSALSACKKVGSQTQTVVKDTINTTALLPPAEAFKRTIDGKQVDLYFIKNNSNTTAAITNYGARVVGLLVPNKSGGVTNVILGFDSLQSFIKLASSRYGATLGRYANRIGGAKFTLDGKTYNLFPNNSGNTLHGGSKGFDMMVWEVQKANKNSIRLGYTSNDGEEGFPGTLNVTVTYTITEDNALKISYQATTDKATVINLSNHCYFNLNGAGNGNILNHTVQISADHYTPSDSKGIPTGSIDAVKWTPFDFTLPATVGSRIDEDDPQLKSRKGYDHHFVLNAYNLTTPAAKVIGDKTGIIMTLYTDQPGMQFYTANGFSGANTLFGGGKDENRCAFAMETMHFPNSPNQPAFPSTVLRPGQTYSTETIYKFSTK